MIYTFYSFKGGVGRSMALANVAELLYNLGLKVLLVDFDLEAPGLERYFNSGEAVISPDEMEEKRGLIDLLVSYNTLRQLLQPARLDPEAFHLDLSFKQPVANEADWLNRFAESDVSALSSVNDPAEQSFPVEPLRSFIQPIYRQNSQGGELFLLPAGQRASGSRPLVNLKRFGECQRDGDEFAHYAERVRAFPWNDFYTKWEGQRFFEWFRKEAQEFADVVLIDSRTGATEMSGICTYHLPDVVVLFAAPNEQNLCGTKLIAESLAQPRLVTEGRKGRKLSLLFVPSRVDLNEKTELDSFSRLFIENFNNFLPRDLTFENNVFVDLKIPYVPFYSFREELAVRDPESPVAAEMINVYKKLCLTLAKLAPPDDKLREKYEPQTIVEGNRSDQLNRFAEAAFTDLTLDEQSAARTILLRFIRPALSEEQGGDTALRLDKEGFNEKDLKIVKRLSDVGLLTIEGESPGPQMIQLANDEFIHSWGRLTLWLDRNREFLLWRQRLKANIEQWESTEREKAALLSGAVLTTAKQYQKSHERELTDLENLYIIQSARRRTTEIIRRIVSITVGALLLGLFIFYLVRQDQQKKALAAQEKTAAVKSALANGDKSLQNGDFNAAVESYEKARTKDPANAVAWNSLGRAYYELGRYPEAIDVLNQALSLKTDYAGAYLNRGCSFNKVNQNEKAIADFNRAILLKPDYAEAYLYRGNAYAQYNTTSAIEDYTRALLLKDNRYDEAYLARGSIYKSLYDRTKDDELKKKAVYDLANAINMTQIPAVRNDAEEKLRILTGAASDNTAQTPHVFVHYNDSTDESVVNSIADDIKNKKITVEGVQLTDGSTIGDIRYYYPEDKQNAQKVQEIVKAGLKSRGRDLDIKLRFLGDYYKNVQRGNIEVWIPSLATVSSLSSSEALVAPDSKSNRRLK